MRTILNTRRWFTLTSTIGELTENGEHIAYVLEPFDAGLDNSKMSIEYITSAKAKWLAKGKRIAISPDNYPLVMAEAPHLLPRFPKLQASGVKLFPLLTNLKGSAGVFIHPGNTAKDTEECQLPGINRGVDEVGNSTGAWYNIVDKYEKDIQAGNVIYSVVREPVAWAAFEHLIPVL